MSFVECFLTHLGREEGPMLEKEKYIFGMYSQLFVVFVCKIYELTWNWVRNMCNRGKVVHLHVQSNITCILGVARKRKHESRKIVICDGSNCGRVRFLRRP